MSEIIELAEKRGVEWVEELSGSRRIVRRRKAGAIGDVVALDFIHRRT